MAGSRSQHTTRLAEILTPNSTGMGVLVGVKPHSITKTGIDIIDNFNHSSNGQFDIVEVCGQAGTGKTFVLLRAIAQCILPQVYGGDESRAIFFDLSLNFDVTRLTKLLALRIPTASSHTSNATIRESLRRLEVYRCESSFAMLTTLHALRHRINREYPVKLIAIDSLASFYWHDVSNEPQRSGLFVSIPNALKLLLQDHRISVFVAKPVLSGEHGRDYSSQTWQDMVLLRVYLDQPQQNGFIHLHKLNDSQVDIDVQI